MTAALAVVDGGAQTPAGAPPANPNFTPPRTASGQPSLEGAWRFSGGGYTYDLEAPAPQEAYPGRDLSNFKPAVVDPPDGKIPYQPWARAKREQFYKAHFNPKSLDELDPQNRCVPAVPPRSNYQVSFQIMQPPGYVVFLNENVHQFRIVPLDNRPHLTDKVKLFVGDSRGHWEGNTLVIDVTNTNGLNWLDVVGDFHSDSFHVVERWTRTGANGLHYEATVEDPKVYTRPWKMVLNHQLLTERGKPYELMEEACWEGNRANQHLFPQPRK